VLSCLQNEILSKINNYTFPFLLKNIGNIISYDRDFISRVGIREKICINLNIGNSEFGIYYSGTEMTRADYTY
jgi:hypothetical protein